MKWKFPGYNARRVKRKFAWLCTELSNRDIVWLETYWQVEQFCGQWDYPAWTVQYRSAEPISIEPTKIKPAEHIPYEQHCKNKDN